MVIVDVVEGLYSTNGPSVQKSSCTGGLHVQVVFMYRNPHVQVVLMYRLLWHASSVELRFYSHASFLSV